MKKTSALLISLWLLSSCQNNSKEMWFTQSSSKEVQEILIDVPDKELSDETLVIDQNESMPEHETIDDLFKKFTTSKDENERGIFKFKRIQSNRNYQVYHTFDGTLKKPYLYKKKWNEYYRFIVWESEHLKIKDWYAKPDSDGRQKLWTTEHYFQYSKDPVTIWTKSWNFQIVRKFRDDKKWELGGKREVLVFDDKEDFLKHAKNPAQNYIDWTREDSNLIYDENYY